MLTIEERDNYGTMEKATHLYIKEIRVIKLIMMIKLARHDHNDHFSSWQGPLGLRFC
jgi:hypothetical protein